jgi:hypothetical protein
LSPIELLIELIIARRVTQGSSGEQELIFELANHGPDAIETQSEVSTCGKPLTVDKEGPAASRRLRRQFDFNELRRR